MDRILYYSTITDNDGRSHGFGELELGEFDKAEDLPTFEAALERNRFKAKNLGYGADLARNLLAKSPCLLWNLNQGLFGETRETQVPSLCDLLGVTLVGSGTWTALVSQDKSLAALLVEQQGTPPLVVPSSVEAETCGEAHALNPPFEGPWFVKPRFEGSSRGISAANLQPTRDGMRAQAGKIAARWGAVRVERYVAGIDVSGNAAVDASGRLRPLPPVAIICEDVADTAEMKADYTNTRRRQLPLADIAPEGVDPVLSAVEQLCRIFRARHYLRTDLRYVPETGEVYFLEANLTPTFAVHDEFVLAAMLGGRSFDELIGDIAEAAWQDFLINRRTLGS